MKRLLTWIGQLAAILIICGACYLGYLLVVASNQTRLAVLTAAVSVGTLAYAQNKNTKREIEARQFQKKVETYEEIVATIGSLMATNRRGESTDQDSLIGKIEAIVPKMMIWSGPEVLNAWELLTTPSEDPLAATRAGSALISALRSELGHCNDKGLGRLGALRFMLTYDARLELESASEFRP